MVTSGVEYSGCAWSTYSLAPLVRMTLASPTSSSVSWRRRDHATGRSHERPAAGSPPRSPTERGGCGWLPPRRHSPPETRTASSMTRMPATEMPYSVSLPITRRTPMTRDYGSGLVRNQRHQRCATSITSRDPEPGPSRMSTRNGSLPRTPRPIVVWPSNDPAQAAWRNVRIPPTGTSSLLPARAYVDAPLTSDAGARATTCRSPPPRSGTAAPSGPSSVTCGTYYNTIAVYRPREVEHEPVEAAVPTSAHVRERRAAHRLDHLGLRPPGDPAVRTARLGCRSRREDECGGHPRGQLDGASVIWHLPCALMTRWRVRRLTAPSARISGHGRGDRCVVRT